LNDDGRFLLVLVLLLPQRCPNQGECQAAQPPLGRYDGAMLDVQVDVDRLREVCERYGIARLDVFGSTSRGDAGVDSDVDLLYSLEPQARLGWRIEDLARELSAVLGRPVDLVSRRALNARIRDKVLAEAQSLYAA
jgi:uncharacterized protein